MNLSEAQGRLSSTKAWLLDQGCNTKATNADRLTPVQIAFQHGHIDLMEFYVEHLGMTNSTEATSQPSLLRLALQSGKEGSVELVRDANLATTSQLCYQLKQIDHQISTLPKSGSVQKQVGDAASRFEAWDLTHIQRSLLKAQRSSLESFPDYIFAVSHDSNRHKVFGLARTGAFGTVKGLLKQFHMHPSGPEIQPLEPDQRDFEDTHCETLLHIAVSRGDARFVVCVALCIGSFQRTNTNAFQRWLLARDCDTRARFRGLTPIQLAFKEGHVKLIHLFASEMDLSNLQSKEPSLVHLAVLSGRPAAVEALIAHRLASAQDLEAARHLPQASHNKAMAVQLRDFNEVSFYTISELMYTPLTLHLLFGTKLKSSPLKGNQNSADENQSDCKLL